MACACKVSQQLSYIERKYGTKTKTSPKTNITLKVKIFFETLLNIVISTLLAPIMLITTLHNRKKVINISKVFGIKKDERNQQVVSN